MSDRKQKVFPSQDISSWLKENGKTMVDLANHLEVSRVYAWRLWKSGCVDVNRRAQILSFGVPEHPLPFVPQHKKRGPKSKTDM